MYIISYGSDRWTKETLKESINFANNIDMVLEPDYAIYVDEPVGDVFYCKFVRYKQVSEQE